MSSPTFDHAVIPASTGSTGRNSVGHGVLLIYAMALVYASLNPFFGWRAPESFGLINWPRYHSAFDIILNVMSYIPLGGMLAAVRVREARRNHSITAVISGVTLAGFALSFIMECLQTMLPVRVASPVDLIANTSGALIGASVLATRWGRAALARALTWRHRYFAAGDECSWGLLLVGAWFVAQLNPLIPFFEAGHIANPSDLAALAPPSAYDPLVLLPQTVGIALNVCGFALFLSLLLRPGKRAMPGVLLTVALGFITKISVASLMLKAPQLASSLGPATIIGVSAGLLIFACFARIGYRWRAFCATLFIFAGGLMAKMSSIYGAFDETLRLFNWPHGHLTSFAGLTRWLHESWPLLAFMLVAWIFVRHRQTQ